MSSGRLSSVTPAEPNRPDGRSGGSTPPPGTTSPYPLEGTLK
nr:MAG TPA: hypothetical protein [Caudoviricetes sp.]